MAVFTAAGAAYIPAAEFRAPGSSGRIAAASGSPGTPTSGTPTPGRAAAGAPPTPTPGPPTPGTARTAPGAPPGPDGAPGAITLEASEDGAGAPPGCAATGSTAGPDGFGVSGMMTDATLSHTAPPLPHVPVAGSGVLTDVSGVTASVPPSRADAAAPMTAILMTDPSSSRLAIGAGQCLKLRRTRDADVGGYPKFMAGVLMFHPIDLLTALLTDPSRGRDGRQPDDRGRLVQAFLPFGVGIGVSGDPAADA